MRTLSVSSGFCPIADAAAFFSTKVQTKEAVSEVKLKKTIEEPKKTVFFTHTPGQSLRIEYRFD